MVTDEEIKVATEAFKLGHYWELGMRLAIEAVDAHREALHKAYLQHIRDEIIKEA